MPIYFAEELTAPEFGELVAENTIGILPVAAIEPHGPHLPLSTDCDIARGHLAELAEMKHDDIDALVLPLQTIGHSLEHKGFAGAFTQSAETLLSTWGSVAETFYASGGRKLIFISSHGGNSEIVNLLATRLRVELGMLAVSASWLRFGQPDGLFSDHELVYGIHGGDIETSLMLHYLPNAVRVEERLNFASQAAAWDADAKILTVHGKTRMGWMLQDINVRGSVGNALGATAEKGAASAAHALAGFSALLRDVAQFDLRRLDRQ